MSKSDNDKHIKKISWSQFAQILFDDIILIDTRAHKTKNTKGLYKVQKDYVKLIKRQVVKKKEQK